MAPTEAERKRFINTLSDSLDSVLSASGRRTAVRERPHLQCTPWRVIEVNVSHDGAWADIEPPVRAFLEEADTSGASLVIVRANATTWFIGLLERYVLWTPTRARLLATDLIVEQSPS
jgi:hypothetical protein